MARFAGALSHHCPSATKRVGLFSFGSSASLAIRILQSWGCDVYVVTRGETHRNAAQSLGANWVGNEGFKPPTGLDRAIAFAPSGNVAAYAGSTRMVVYSDFSKGLRRSCLSWPDHGFIGG
jgi:D-arabinose 1-dehydrogenase-like Zn-dependent alcohol dehydrogenase